MSLRTVSQSKVTRTEEVEGNGEDLLTRRNKNFEPIIDREVRVFLGSSQPEENIKERLENRIEGVSEEEKSSMVIPKGEDGTGWCETLEVEENSDQEDVRRKEEIVAAGIEGKATEVDMGDIGRRPQSDGIWKDIMKEEISRNHSFLSATAEETSGKKNIINLQPYVKRDLKEAVMEVQGRNGAVNKDELTKIVSENGVDVTCSNLRLHKTYLKWLTEESYTDEV